MFIKKLILPICIFTIINNSSYSSEINTSIIPYGTYKNPCIFEEKDNNVYDAKYKKAEYYKLWDVLCDSLVVNNISKNKRIIVDDFVSYCNTLCNRINFKYIMQDLPQYCSEYYNIAEQVLYMPCINGLQQQYIILSERNINFEQLLNYYSNSMYSICINSINEMLNSNNKNDILQIVSSYIDVIQENINWFQEYLVPNLDIEDGKYNIKYTIINNIESALTFPINGLNMLKNNIRTLS